jgi:hypothetical protein
VCPWQRPPGCSQEKSHSVIVSGSYSPSRARPVRLRALAVCQRRRD